MVHEVKKRALLTVEPGSRVIVSPAQLRAAGEYLEPAIPDGVNAVDPDELKAFVDGAVSDRVAQLSAEHEARIAAVISEKDTEIAALSAENESLKTQINSSDGDMQVVPRAITEIAVPESVYRMLFSKLTATELAAVALDIGVEVPDGAKKPDITELLLKRVV